MPQRKIKTKKTKITSQPKYSFSQIEKKWQKEWAKNNYEIFHASDNPKKKHLYILDMFPYPSGEGLHVGHVEGYTASDILSRYYRMNGWEVLHPMGWDAFGLPAENYALKTKIPPQKTVPKNINRFREQLRSLGFSYDWQREINTTDPDYYRWTQWIFLKLYEKGLAYEEEVPVNWCDNCKTVLSNEEVQEGKCERCQSPVQRKHLRQWLLKITAYADRLLDDLNFIDWPERVKLMQRNWIGRSEGVEIEFKIDGLNEYLKVFTTRPETIFGVTYLVLAPEHPLIKTLVSQDRKTEVERYINEALNYSDFERQLNKEKSGIFLGIYAINPANRQKIPVWVSDYVLMNYGTGAVMAVPSHDKRDFEFAKKFNLPTKPVISPDKNLKEIPEPYEGEGIMINSGPFNGLPSKKAKEKIAFYVGGKKAVYYKLRDWIFSRQRYWGEPIPIIKCEKCGNVPLKEKDLPLKLPPLEKFQPTGKNESPLADIASWVNIQCPKCGGPAKRETNTMPQWAGSCWYYLRYLDPKNKKFLVDFKKQKTWLPVNLYIGGVEHAVLHLLYARFWHKFLYDLGIVSSKEPFFKLINQGTILGEDGEKMSKSRGNVVSPDEVIKKYGADALRMYEMFLGPLTSAKSWQTNGVIGVYRFLNRVWDLVTGSVLAKKEKKSEKIKMTKESQEKLKELINHLEITRQRTIKKVTEDIEHFRFNTAISTLMEYLNHLEEIPKEKIDKKHLETLILLLSPFAPHLCEELASSYLGFKKPLLKTKWPTYKPDVLKENQIVIVVQVNGKTRATLKVTKGLSQKEVEKQSLPLIKKYLNQKIKRIVFVPDKIINFVF